MRRSFFIAFRALIDTHDELKVTGQVARIRAEAQGHVKGLERLKAAEAGHAVETQRRAEQIARLEANVQEKDHDVRLGGLSVNGLSVCSCESFERR